VASRQLNDRGLGRCERESLVDVGKKVRARTMVDDRSEDFLTEPEATQPYFRLGSLMNWVLLLATVVIVFAALLLFLENIR